MRLFLQHLFVMFVPRYFGEILPSRARITSSPIASVSRNSRVRVGKIRPGIARFIFSGASGDQRLENYDKQMRLGNAAVDDCSSQGLPDFYFFSFFLFLFSLLLSPLLSFSRSVFLLCPAPPVHAFLFVASRPPPRRR